LKVVYLILCYSLVIYGFIRTARRYGNEERKILAHLPAEYHAPIQLIRKRIVMLAAAGAVILMLVVPVLAPIYAMITEGISSKDALGRGVLLLCGAPFTFFAGVFWGLSLGILTAPEWYLRSPLGWKWCRLTGGASIKGARFVALIATLMGLAIFLIMFWATRKMAPFA
jgi:hypothetical protein